eukprot:CAMPEP_0206621738 /NCGR_PEP_ID=MMETSP0325_2-20121206/62377_1 /ASSEMBLY_ACC=CAM_ASM_000347 /TAXON_ID=2866 /ORGANISM="Crypthecodinium cohnii, Strain Seligo" /LENGTH=38 /DNA_ID= /DNA_START= /DNA_END= /DNA_ORIENTATION=
MRRPSETPSGATPTSDSRRRPTPTMIATSTFFIAEVMI